MERGAKKSKSKKEPKEELVIRKEHRTLLRECFKKSSRCSLIPFDIWKVVVARAALRSTGNVAQLSRGFRELVRQLRRSDIKMALGYRKAGQIPLARHCVTVCAEHGNTRAMLLLGIAFENGGWGYSNDNEKQHYWLKKAAEGGDATGMALFARYLDDVPLFNKAENKRVTEWTTKVLSSGNNTAIALCNWYGLSIAKNDDIAFELFEIAAKNGDEIAQDWLGYCYQTIGDLYTAFQWHLLAAEQGVASSQLSLHDLHKLGCRDERIGDGKDWKRRANQQGCYDL